MPQELISVIVPIYKVEKYINSCVDSILNQTYRNLEVILVDDGSTDNCPAICEQYKSKDNRVKVVHKENGGLSDARNAGLKVVTGSIVAFIDSDDWIDSKMFEKMYDRMHKDNSDIVSCGVKWVTEDGKLLRNVSVNDECLETEKAMEELLYDNKLKQHVWNKLYKYDIVKDIPFEKGKFHEDVFWSYQVIGKAKKVSLMTESFYNYIQRDNSIMGETYSSKRLDALDAMKLRCEYIKEKFPDLFDVALFFYIGSCLYHLQSAIRTKQDEDVVSNILNRLDCQKEGNICKGLEFKQKIWFKMFRYFPVLTAKLRNALKVGI